MVKIKDITLWYSIYYRYLYNTNNKHKFNPQKK